MHKIGVGREVRHAGHRRDPLDRVDPRGVAGEVGGVLLAAAPQDADDGVVVVLRPIRAVLIEPVLVGRADFHRVAHRTGVRKLVVAERHAQQVQPDPTHHRFGRRFLIVAAGAADAARPRMAGPRIEVAQLRQFAVVHGVGVLARDQRRHRAVVVEEVGIEQPEHRRGVGEVAVMEMVVVELVRAVARLHANDRTHTGVTGEVVFLLAGTAAAGGRVGVPIDEFLFEPVLDGVGFGVADRLG